MSGLGRAAGIYGGLLAVLLGASWMKWTAEPDVDLEGKIVLLQGDAEDIQTVSWKSEKDEALLEARSDEHGSYWWVTYTKWEKAAGPEAPAEDEPAEGEQAEDEQAEGEEPPAEEPPAEEPPAEEPEKVAKVSHFKSGKAAEDLASALSPLLAIRKLEAVPAEKLATIGLDEESAKDRVEIVRKGRTTTLEVGGEAYGTRDRYVRDLATGEIFLVDDEVLRPLKYARTRLPDRELFSIESDQVATVQIEAGAGSLEVQHKNPQDKEKATWVRADAPEDEAAELVTWMDKALKLKGTSYAEADELDESALEFRFRLSLRTEKGEEETLVVEQVGADGDWYGSTEHTRARIKLLRGPTSGLFEDVDGVIGG